MTAEELKNKLEELNKKADEFDGITDSASKELKQLLGDGGEMLAAAVMMAKMAQLFAEYFEVKPEFLDSVKR